ncbi:Secreted effector protein pipB2 [Gimesia alba]|uniref:Secreted effector protein pipB2 n=1 Tax=Gimesia alba TaxID=2527973 RepID=A0A517RHR4_9PLAN|nr:pentapeptide repeat-containing protein [Gimesia alba]QDT43392.1 Secreted effector protein pipB2 [Gimesia alba]
MDREKALSLLLGGAEGIQTWNQIRSSSSSGLVSGNDTLESINLRGVDWQGALLLEADLRRVDLTDSDLRQAILYHANLEGACLEGSNLSQCDLIGANLSNANLRNARLDKADLGISVLSGADLRNANFKAANLAAVDLRNGNCDGTEFCLANLRRARLDGSSFIATDLRDAIMEDVTITDAKFMDLTGYPRPPKRLRLNQDGTEVLVGEAAHRYFQPPAVVEVFLTELLSDEEIACYHIHMAELHLRKVAISVAVVGVRSVQNGSILRFQAPDTEMIYQALPDLLAPFRMAKAIDWLNSFSNQSKESQSHMIGSLIKAETKKASSRWRFAERMAEVFRGYRKARVYQIQEGSSRGIRIDIYTNYKIADKLAREGLPDVWDGRGKLLISTGDHTDIHVGDENMRDKYEVVQAGAVGPRATVNNSEFHQIWAQQSKEVEVSRLAEDLAVLREAMKRESNSASHDVSIGEIAAAEKATHAGDGPRAIEHLKKAGIWAFEISKKIGVEVAIAMIKAAQGI